MSKPVEGVDFYWENGKIVFTDNHHTNRGYCCGNGCHHCPYNPKHKKGSTKIK